MFKTKTISKNIDESQLSHTKWNCMYHIVFICVDCVNIRV